MGGLGLDLKGVGLGLRWFRNPEGFWIVGHSSHYKESSIGAVLLSIGLRGIVYSHHNTKGSLRNRTPQNVLGCFL